MYFQGVLFRCFLHLTVIFVSVTNAQLKTGLNAEILGGFGFGVKTKPSTSSESLQPYNLGAGLRMNYTFDNGVHLGATAIFHKGESVNARTTGQEPGGYPEPRSFTLHTRIQYYGIELGYSIPINLVFTIRPYGGLGLGRYRGAILEDAANLNGLTAYPSGPRPYFAPAISFLYELTGNLFTVADFRYTIFADYRRANAITAFAGLGMNF